MGSSAGIVLLSLEVAALSVAVSLPAALAAGMLLAKIRFRGKVLVEGIIDIPLVMPPVTTGYLLLLLLGKNGLVGGILDKAGIQVAFTTAAAVLAAAVVSFPLMVRSIRLGIEYVDPGLEQAAHTLGAGRLGTFFRVTLPLALPGVLSGAVLGFARSLGEFGATITFAGNIDGVSRTIPLAVYSLLQVPGEERSAAILVAVSVVISFAAMALSSRINQRLRKGAG